MSMRIKSLQVALSVVYMCVCVCVCVCVWTCRIEKRAAAEGITVDAQRLTV